jgi:hypothetical protein
MKRLLTIWLALVAAFWLTRAASSALLFGRADLGFEATLQLVAIPALQAVVLGWATRRRGAAGLGAPWRAAQREAWLRGVLAFDGAVLAAGWLGWFGGPDGRLGRVAWLALARGPTVIAWAACGKLAAAAGLLAAVLARGRRRMRERALLGLLAAFSLALGAPAWLGGLDRLATAIALRGEWGSPWLAVYAPLAVVGTALALAAQDILRRCSLTAALALEWAIGLAVAALLAAWTGALSGHLDELAAAMHGNARYAAATAPWAAAAATLATLATTALLAAALLAWREEASLHREELAPDGSFAARSGEKRRPRAETKPRGEEGR